MSTEMARKNDKHNREMREKIEELDQRIAVAQYLGEIRRIQQEDEERREYWEQSQKFLEHMARSHPYRIYLIAYDLVYHDHFHIEDDLLRGKITINDVERAVEYSKKYITSRNDFSAERFKEVVTA